MGESDGVGREQSGRFVVIAGPSGVGKSPLAKALARLYAEEYGRLRPVVLYNSRVPRPGEVDGVDYYFRARGEVEGLGRANPDRYVAMDVRGDMQALDVEELEGTLGEGDAFFEGNPFMGRVLVEAAAERGVPCLSIFVSPLSGDELRELAADAEVSVEEVVRDVMRRKLRRRMERQRGELDAEDEAELERRCGSAWRELSFATAFEWVIANHDGEDSENWDAFPYPVGDARRAVEAVAGVLRGQPRQPGVESWREGVPWEGR